MSASKTKIIAEVGVNHNGDISLAISMVDAAASAGVDIVKFQSFKADSLATPVAPVAPYQKKDLAKRAGQRELLRSLELDKSDFARIKNHCVAKGVEFLSTAFDEESLDDLVELGIKRVKVPSGEITNLPFLEKVGGLGLPIIISTGMANLEEIKLALDVLLNKGAILEQVTILQCTTSYPTPIDQVNLRAIKLIADTFGCEVGFSDHSLGNVASMGAIALGATVIEKHITTDQLLPGPDHKASMPVLQLPEFVRNIRDMEEAMGDGMKTLKEVEKSNIVVARKSIVAKVDINKGELFCEENLTVKRPATGISPMNWYKVIGKRASRNLQKDETLQPNDFN